MQSLVLKPTCLVFLEFKHLCLLQQVYGLTHVSLHGWVLNNSINDVLSKLCPLHVFVSVDINLSKQLLQSIY